MPRFVHLTPERFVKRILRSGITGERGVFCLPVLPSYVIAHQWLRELKRGGQRTIMGVYWTCSDHRLHPWEGDLLHTVKHSPHEN